MCCITFAMQDFTMTTTQLMRAAGCEACWTGVSAVRNEYRPPRMNWIVVTDENHNRRMQMPWAPSAVNR